MNVNEAIRTVLAVRAFQDKPVPAGIRQEILEAAHLSASGSNKQPWHFIAIEDPERIKGLARFTPTGPYVAEAPFVVVVAAKKGLNGLSDASRAIQDMILVAWSEGVGSNWVGWGNTLDGVKEFVGIPSESDLEIIAVLPFGYPVESVGKGKKNRKPFDEVIHRETFSGVA
ncbi:MAG TPA: nitroreductase family protein [Thermomicrobiales bacterium]|nr:nitroreductase family protein [Thermomicrobiales bacterium]